VSRFRGVDVVDVLAIESGVSQGVFMQRAGPFSRPPEARSCGRRHRSSRNRELCVNLRAAPLRRARILEHPTPAPLQNESVASLSQGRARRGGSPLRVDRARAAAKPPT